MPQVISNIECACGCETLMTIATVERGWQYIRGHKPKGLRPYVKPQPKMPRQTPGKSSLEVAAIGGEGVNSAEGTERTQRLLPAPAKECSYCGDDIGHIYSETSFGPQLNPGDGQPVCDECWHEHFEFECIRCGSSDHKEDQHKYLVILEECGGMKPGIYRTRGAYWSSNYFDMWWNPRSLSRLRDADGKFYNEGEYPSGHLCYGCRIELNLVEPTKH